MTTYYPDLITTNFEPLRFQRDVDKLGYRTIEQVIDEREVFDDASDRKMVKFTSKDSEDFPSRGVLTGIMEHGPFSRVFFSVDNMKWLHSNIRYEVYNRSINKTVISKQRDSEVLESMRRIYLQNSTNPDDIKGIKDEILRLNTLVLNDTVPRIISEISQYKHYLRDIEKIRTPVELPKNTSITGTKLYERGPADVLGLNV